MANRTAVLNTTKGVIKFELYEDLAPITANNFIDLVERGFYNGLTFHRHEPGFVIQGGDPAGNGSGDFQDPTTGKKRTIPLEVSPMLKHDGAGVVAMARSSDPNSASCQFYITLGAASFLDMKYAVFGRVTVGLDAALKLGKGDKISSATIETA
jgi:peptidyl-prolyl cis-trans isomerase B (cyclophilin B)